MGERLELGPLELKVLGVLWERGRTSTVRHVQPSFPQLAYPTVMTTLDRLYRKGVLRRQIMYQAAWADHHVIRVDAFYPSSKTCSGFGAVNAALRLYAVTSSPARRRPTRNREPAGRSVRTETRRALSGTARRRVRAGL